MNIVVAMKQVPDLQQIRMSDGHPVMDDIVYTFGDIDRSALEAAVKLKEAREDVQITLLGVGNEELEDTAKEALAAGADKAYLICDDEFGNLQGSQNAVLLAEALKTMGDADLILLGEGSGDNYSGQMIGRLAEVCDMAQIGSAQAIELQDSKVVVERALEDHVEVVESAYPVVVSVTASICEPRIPAVTQILKAGRKPKEVLDASDVEVNLPEKQIEVLDSRVPENNREGAVLSSIDELLEALKSKNLL